jgi:hypothetical protein
MDPVSRFIDAEPRQATPDELRLLRALLDRATSEDSTRWRLEALLVRGYNDGAMGSVRLLPGGVDRPSRRFGREIAEIQFHDTDGGWVSAALNLDEQGDLFEVDIWKGDSSPLHQIPADLERPAPAPAVARPRDRWLLPLVTCGFALTLYGMWALGSWFLALGLGAWTLLVLPLVFAAPAIAIYWLLDRRRRRIPPPE